MNDKYDFESLEAWKQASEFRREISKLTKKFPSHEKYELVSQVNRSARSVHNNIAEGHGRFSYTDNIRFIRISSGSLKETMDHLYTARDEKYIEESELAALKTRYEHCRKLINGYIAYLKRARAGS